MDAAQWPQGIGVVRGSSSSVDVYHECSRIDPAAEKIIKKPRAEKEELILSNLKCPRCKSSNTKFCYYNNYSLSQPRYFCKSCRRYWTAGGTLRNVPVGGTSRKKNKTRSSSSSISTTKSSIIPDLSPPKFPPHQNPNIHLNYLSSELPFTHLNPQNPNLDTAPGMTVSNTGFELGFSVENRFGNMQAAVQEEPRISFPYEEDRGVSNGFWSRMLSGDSW